MSNKRKYAKHFNNEKKEEKSETSKKKHLHMYLLA